MIDPNKIKNAKSGSFPSELSPTEAAIAKFRADFTLLVFKRRKLLGLTQAQFASQYGLSQSIVSKLETGDGSVSLKTVFAVATNLGIDIQLNDCSIHNSSPYHTEIIPFNPNYGLQHSSSRISGNSKFHTKGYTPSELHHKEM